jgi:hypothetical protein
MPQFEKTTFFSQILYFCIVFSAFYFVTNSKYTHVFLFFKKITEKKRKYHSELKTSTLNTVNQFKTLTTLFFDLIVNNNASQSEKIGSFFLNFFRNYTNIVSLNKGFIAENISKTEQSLNKDLPATLKTNKISQINFNLQNLENLKSTNTKKKDFFLNKKVNFQM